MVTIELFAQRMNLRATEVRAAVVQAVKLAAEAAVKTVTEETPADTGQARSNWITTLNNPTALTIPAYSPGSHLGMGETANAGAAQAQARPSIDAYADGGSVIIQNNLPYIAGLNDGSISVQSSHMVEKAGQAAVTAAQTVKIFS